MPRSDRQRNYALFRVRPQLLIKSRFAELRHIQSLTFTLGSYIFPTRGCTICEVTSIIQTKNTLPLCLLMAVALKTVGNRKRECDPTGNNKNITRTRDKHDRSQGCLIFRSSNLLFIAVDHGIENPPQCRLL